MQRVQFGRRHVDLTERVFRLLDLVAMAHVAVLHARAPLELEDVGDILQRHRETLDPICELDADGREIDAACLLKVRELGDLLAVEEDLPSDPPGPERRRFPVVFLEPHVVRAQIDAARLQTLQIELLDFVRRGLEDDLELMVFEQTVGVFAEAPIGRSPRRLDVCDAPVGRSKHAQKRFRVHRACPHFDVERLLQKTAAGGPEFGQLENELLQGQHASEMPNEPGASRAGRGPTSAPSRGAR